MILCTFCFSYLPKALIVIIIIIIPILVMTVIFCSIQTRQEKVLKSLGKYDSKQVWTHGEFQDYTDFGRYSYSSAKIDPNKNSVLFP